MFIKSEKHPSPPFTRNYLTLKLLNKKVKGEGLKTLFYIYARQGKKRKGTLGSKIGKTLNKEYNIRFKIYPSPFTLHLVATTQLPYLHHRITYICLLGLSFGDIPLFFGDNFLSFGDIPLSFGVMFLSFGDILPNDSMIFSHFISRIYANRTNRIGRKRKRRIFALEIKRMAKCENL